METAAPRRRCNDLYDNPDTGRANMNARILAFIGALCALFLPTAASAYIGPGAGASLAGSLFGVLAAIAVAIGVVLFWPLRLMYKKIKGNKSVTRNANSSESADNASTSAAA